jgi:glycosyltransferase involved in cell wall biosynthesis
LPVELTVLVITYNHASFIGRALDGVLCQETDFEWEIIISEDCSTDGTREIVQDFARLHPERARLLLSDSNLNDNTVVRRGLEAARGRFIALLDGDDFWTSSEKLQRQVSFLRSHPECSSCFHNVHVIYDDGSPGHQFFEDEPADLRVARTPKPRSTLADIVLRDFIPTCSTVFRADLTRELPEWYDDLPGGDWPLHVLCAQHGELAYLDEILATYRVHPGGVWTRRSKFPHLSDVEDHVRAYDVLDEYLAFAYRAAIARTVARFYEGVAVTLYRRGDYPTALVCARRALSRTPRARRLIMWRSVAAMILSRLRMAVAATKSAPRG